MKNCIKYEKDDRGTSYHGRLFHHVETSAPHFCLDGLAGGGVRQTAQRRLPELHGDAAAHLAHGVDDLVHGDAALDARQRHIRRTDGVDGADDIALDARLFLTASSPSRIAILPASYVFFFAILSISFLRFHLYDRH